MNWIKIKATLTEDMLGTACANPEVHEEYIASRSADADKAKEEMEALSAAELIEKAMTVFPRNVAGMPILWDYQVKGFIKEAMETLVNLSKTELKIGKTKLSNYTVKRIVDRYVFVTPRQIPLAPISGTCTRPLRAQTMRGERVSLATSEVVPAGTVFEFTIHTMAPELDELILECLNYGALKGLGQWRNSGKGAFTYVVG